MDLYSAACRTGGNYWNYHPGVLSLNQVIATYLEIKARQNAREFEDCILKWIS